MHPLRADMPLALAACAIVASPAAAKPGDGPTARASGGSAGPPIYPGLVNSRLVRTQKALDHAIGYADDGDTAKAVNSLFNARLQVKLAWRAAKYAIQHAPPPPTGDGLKARQSGAAVAGSWATIMPPVGDAVEDEIDQIEGAMDLSTTLGKGVREVYQDAELQTVKTQRTITTYWPPVVGD